MRRKMKPNLELYNHLGEGRLSSSVTDALIGALESCLPSVLALPEGPVPVLSGLDEVEISVVSDDGCHYFSAWRRNRRDHRQL